MAATGPACRLFFLEVMAALLPSVACSEEVVPPSNAFHLAPLCEEVSWHFMQPAVRIHDQEHSERRLISRHNIRRSAVQAQCRGYPRVGERPGMPQRRFWSHPSCSEPAFEMGFLPQRRANQLRDGVFLWLPPMNLNGCIFRPSSDRRTQPAFSESPCLSEGATRS